jgi:hypothetical protein
MRSRELLILRTPLYSMSPSFLNLFMKKFTEAVAVLRESTPLGIGQSGAPHTEVLFEDAVLVPQVTDDLNLVAIHPARQRHEEDPQPDRVDHGPSLLALAVASLG